MCGLGLRPVSRRRSVPPPLPPGERKVSRFARGGAVLRRFPEVPDPLGGGEV